jgi:hypothetical protein
MGLQGPAGPAGEQGPPGKTGPVYTTFSSTTVLGPGVQDPGYISAMDVPYYFSIFAGDRSLLSGAKVEEPLADAGTLVRFSVGLNSAPVSGGWTFSLMRGEEALLSCAITGGNRSCQATGSKPVSMYDKLYIKCDPGTNNNSSDTAFTAAAFQIRYLNN